MQTKYICPWLDEDSSYFLPPRYVSALSNYTAGIETATSTSSSPTLAAKAVESRTKRESVERVARRRAWSEEQQRIKPRRNMAI